MPDDFPRDRISWKRVSKDRIERAIRLASFRGISLFQFEEGAPIFQHGGIFEEADRNSQRD